MLVIFLFVVWCMINLGIFPYFVSDWDSFYFFNPIRNYNTWTQFNWFGIAVITILLNVIFAPYAVVYWIYKLFTIGRKEKYE